MSDNTISCVTPSLVINLFGEYQALLDGRSLQKLRRGDADRLLALLILRRERENEIERTALAANLWPSHRNPSNTLVKSLKNLEAALGREAFRVQRSHTHIHFDVSGAVIDVVEFDEAIRRNDSESFKRAVTIYFARGEGGLLQNLSVDDAEDNWLSEEREDHLIACRKALEELVKHTTEPDEIEGYLRKLIAIDPASEAARCSLIAVLDRTGNVEAAKEERSYLVRSIPDLSQSTRLFLQGLGNKWRSAEKALPSQPQARDMPWPPPHNLPEPHTKFIGRAKEIETVKMLLTFRRLVTLIGTGGVGKTKFALRIAEDLKEDYPDGVWFVDLATLTEPILIPHAIASALGMREEANRPLMETLRSNLKPKSLLLVLDNCEHLLQACAILADTLLRTCQNLRLLTTSREKLGITGEQIYRVPSLSLPDPEQPMPARNLAGYEAVQLFIDRALLSQSTFAITNESLTVVAQVCHRLDGIPLAIELAAARVRALSVEQICQRLDDRFNLLSGGDRTKPERYQTLRATMDWSYDLLSEKERALLRRLSVFVGGWTLSAAEAICVGSGIEERDVIDLLTSLVDKSLVIYEEQRGQERYRLLEMVRQYGRDQLIDLGEAEIAQGSHLDFFLHLAEEAEPKLTGFDQVMWFQRLEAEHDNFRAALLWSKGEAGRTNDALRIAGALGRFWLVRGYYSEGRDWLEGALALQEAAELTQDRAKALNAAGRLADLLGDYVAGRALCEESLSIYRQSGSKLGVATVLNSLGTLAKKQCDYGLARDLFEESLVLCRLIGDDWGAANVIINLGQLAQNHGDYAVARSLYEEGLAIRQELGDKRGVANALNDLGFTAYDQGDYTVARAFHEKSLEMRRELENKEGIASSLTHLGMIAHAQGDYLTAQALYEESLAICRGLGDRWGIAAALNNLGSIAEEQGNYAVACSLHEEALALRRELGDKRCIATSLNNLGNLALDQSDYAAARSFHEEALALRKELRDRAGIASSLNNLGGIVLVNGDYAVARSFLEESLALGRELGDKHSIADSLNNLGSIAHYQGDDATAQSLYEESLAIRRELGENRGIASALNNLGLVAYCQGQYESARALLTESLTIRRDLQDKIGIAACLAGLSGAFRKHGEPERAACLLGAAEALRDVTGARLQPSDLEEYNRNVSDVRAALSEEIFAAAWALGRTMTMEQAVAYALGND